jgi:RimJ/RimL family protein N-acetyltransferase
MRKMAMLTAEPLDVILRDGRTLRLRSPGPDDANALLAFFSSLSQQSLYRRFHGFPEIGPRLVEPLVSADAHEAGALVGCVDDRIVAVANFARLRDPKAAEVAFAVADDYQRRGIGTRLLEQLAARAAELGVERFVAETLPVVRSS